MSIEYFQSVCSKCDKCPASLMTVPRRFPTIEATGNTRVYVIMDNPDDQDWDSPSNPRAMPSVEVFKTHLQQVGWTAEEIDAQFTFAFSVRSPKKKLTATDRRTCGMFNTADIARLRPELVVLWNKDIWSTWGKANGAPKIGRVQKLEELTWHVPGGKPSAVPVDWDCQVLTVTDPVKFLDFPQLFCPDSYYMDLAKIRWTLDGQYPIAPETAGTYETVTDPARAVQLLDYFAGLPQQAVDIETGNAPHALDVYSVHFKVLGVSLSAQAGTGYFIPLWHKDARLIDTPEVAAAYERWRTAGIYRVMHNGVNFDGPALKVPCDFDTMLADRLVNENRPHTLKHVTAAYEPQLGNYEDALDDYFYLTNAKGERTKRRIASKDRDYEKHLPLEVLGLYACIDADATWRYYQRLVTTLLPAIPAPGWDNALDFFLRHDMADAQAAARTSANGMLLDNHRVGVVRETFGAKEEEARAALMAHDCVAKFAMKQAADYTAKGAYFVDGGMIWAAYHVARDCMQPLFDLTKGEELEYGARDKLVKNRVLKQNLMVSKAKTFTRSDVEFRPSSSTDTKTMMQLLNLKSTKQTGGGADSWDKNVLKTFAAVNPFVADLLSWRAADKAYTTYARPLCQGLYTYTSGAGDEKIGFGWLRDDGLVHADFLLAGNDKGFGTDAEDSGGTKTGRKSSRRPNLQNVEKHSAAGKMLYSAFCSRYADPRFPFAMNERHSHKVWEKMTPSEQAKVKHFVFPGQPGGGLILQADYSQLELRLFAIIVNCEWMLEQYRLGKDLHLAMALEAFGVDPNGPLYDEDGQLLPTIAMYRAAAKSLWFGPIYGEGAAGMHADMVKKGIRSRINPEQMISLEEVEGLLENTYAKMPEFEAYKTKLSGAINGPGHSIYTITGRRRFLPHAISRQKWVRSRALRQAVNTTIQGPGADITNWSFYTLENALLNYDGALICNTVHDSIVFDMRSELLPVLAPWIKRVMEAPPFPMVNQFESPIPLKVDLEAGPTWGELADVSSDLLTEWDASQKVAA